MNKKLRYICIFLILPIVMAVVFIVSLSFEDKKKGDEEATTEASKVYSDEEINAMLLAEYQKSQSTREFQEITTETVELTPEDNEYDDMIDETDAGDVKGEVIGEDDLSDEDEAVIAEAEKQSWEQNVGINYGGIQIVSSLNQVDVSGGFVLEMTQDEINAPHPLLLQYDPRWANFPYGMGTMKSSACGPTCFSMVITALTNITNASPPLVATYSMNHNHYVRGAGTAHSLFTQGASDFGLYCTPISVTEMDMKAHLDAGEMLILACHYGNFTHSGAGHFIMIYGYNENGFMVNDPASYERSTRYWPWSVIGGDIDNIYAFGRAY